MDLWTGLGILLAILALVSPVTPGFQNPWLVSALWFSVVVYGVALAWFNWSQIAQVIATYPVPSTLVVGVYALLATAGLWHTHIVPLANGRKPTPLAITTQQDATVRGDTVADTDNRAVVYMDSSPILAPFTAQDGVMFEVLELGPNQISSDFMRVMPRGTAWPPDFAMPMSHQWVTLRNYSSQPLFNTTLELHVRYLEEIPTHTGSRSGSVVANRSYLVTIPVIDPDRGIFQFVLRNNSNTTAIVVPPDFVSDNGRRIRLVKPSMGVEYTFNLVSNRRPTPGATP